MVDITKISTVATIAKPQTSNPLNNRQWDTQLKTTVIPNNSVKTIQIELDKVPQNITNQNATLSPQQMAEHLSRELAKRTAQNKAVKSKSRYNMGNDLSNIIGENKSLSSFFESGNEDTIAEFLAFFQSAMARHLKGFEFGNIMYDQELIDKFMEKY